MTEYNIERLNVLVVDDNRHMRFLVRMILKSLGVRDIMEAEEGESAIKTLSNFDADIVICDWNMQPMDGIAFTREMRSGSDSPNRYVPIILLTGHTELTRVREARDAGVNEFLAKPISATSIYSRIRSIIEKPRQFIRAEGYFGPDRRRRDTKDYPGPFRRSSDVDERIGSDAHMIG